MAEKKRLFTRRRAVLLLLLAAVVGCAALAVSSLHSLLERQRRAERRAAELSVEERLKVARRLADGYVADRLAARTRLERQLTRQAVALCGEVRVFLQASLLGREARESEQKLAAERERRGRLHELAKGQLRIISRLAARVRGLEQEAAEAHLLAGNFPSITTVEAAPAPAPDGGVAAVAAEGGEPAPEPAPEPLPDSEADERLIEQLAVAAPERPDPEWADRLIQECSLDFKNLLPANCSLIIAEVGRQVLLTFGDGTVRPGEVRGSASVPLILKHGSDPRQWMVTLTLAEVDAPEPPDAQGLARFLDDRLNAGRERLRGFVLEDDGRKIAAVFPAPGKTVRPLLPANRAWVEMPEAEQALYYRTLDAPAANADYPWKLGLQIAIDQPRASVRLEHLAAAHPWSALGFGVGCLLLLGAFVAAAVLGWSSSSAAPAPARAASGEAAERLEPVLGSLARLQAANRLHPGASNIMATAKSRLLRDLAARVSPPAGGAHRAPAKKELRQYRS